jgi:hypothetical protein
MSIKISELPLAGTVSGTELVPIVQDGTTSQISLSQLGPVVPSTAKLLIPDVSTILSGLLDIVDNFGLTGTATYSDDSLWATFTASNVFNTGQFINPVDFYVNGFYNENEYTDEGGDILNIGYSGVVDFNVLNGGPNPDYSGGSVYLLANVDPDTYDILSFVNLSVKTDVGLDYTFEDDGTGLYNTAGIFSNIAGPNVVLTFDIEVDVANDTVDWEIGILPNILP